MNTDEEPIVFKAQIYALTGVLPERQKVMCKGVALKDDDWGNIKLSNVSILLNLCIYRLIRKYNPILIFLGCNDTCDGK